MNTQENRQRLFKLDENLRAEADAMLQESGIGEVLKKEGFHPAGSYAMRTMCWKDLDFERDDDTPDWEEHWELGKKFARLDWVWSVHAINGYADPRTENPGYYWGLRAVRPGQRDFWKLDIWTARREEFESQAPQRPLWDSRLTEDTRYEILVIKEAVCHRPEYRDTMLSTHIYEAVLEKGVRGTGDFLNWWNNKYGIIKP